MTIFRAQIFGERLYLVILFNNQISSNDLSVEIELFSSIVNEYENEYEYEYEDEYEDWITDSTNMVLPDAMFFNGISLVLNDTLSCQETEIGMNIKI